LCNNKVEFESIKLAPQLCPGAYFGTVQHWIAFNVQLSILQQVNLVVVAAAVVWLLLAAVALLLSSCSVALLLYTTAFAFVP
jgi:hypothetical protein